MKGSKLKSNQSSRNFTKIHGSASRLSQMSLGGKKKTTN